MDYIVDALFEVQVKKEVGTVRAYAEEGDNVSLKNFLPGNIKLLR